MIELIGMRRCLVSMWLGAVLLAGAGCRPKPEAAVTAPPPPIAAQPAPKAAQEDTADKTPVKDSLTALLERDAKADHIFPADVKVKSVTISDGVVTIDFSRQFSELANSGETVESDAQHALQKDLARFATIHKMRVTVEGKPFESQATDWETPFSVRPAPSEDSRVSKSSKSSSVL